MSWLIDSIIQGSYTWTIPLVFLIVIIDIILVSCIKKKNYEIKNKYFEMNARFGIQKFNILKIVFALAVLWQASKPITYNPLGYFLSILIYSSVVLKLLVDFIKKERKKKVL